LAKVLKERALEMFLEWFPEQFCGLIRVYPETANAYHLKSQKSSEIEGATGYFSAGLPLVF
jgi:hypothetical protein